MRGCLKGEYIREFNEKTAHVKHTGGYLDYF